MAMTQKRRRKPIFMLIAFLIGLSFLVSAYVSARKQADEAKFLPPRRNTSEIQYTIGKNVTLEAVIGDLAYYDFIQDKEAFRHALEFTFDATAGDANSLRIGSNTIDREATYTISQSMSAWEISRILLNEGTHQDCDHGCPDSNFMPQLLPGGDLAPTIAEKYAWVETYEDCVKAIGADGGQLSSEQYFQHTGIRTCVSPDQRQFTQGKEGSTEFVGG
ncbi:hypothetical protein C4579_03080 [Candidatus Microgenomates bacterium]|nr:MAG: hypothetical protein C4579_03080 [Candidatus Microgenomates bacterium]